MTEGRELTHVRVEVVDVAPLPGPWAKQQRVGHPHPLAREAYDRSLFMETLADLETWWPAVRWLVVAANLGALIALRAPTWVWWASIPAGVAVLVDGRLPRDTFARAVRLGLSTEPDEVRDG